MNKIENATELDRKSGIDILKIVSMILVIMYHVTIYGVNSEDLTIYSLPYWIINIFKCISIICVNCFVLITGYFMCKSKVKLKKILLLWIQVEMYSVGIYLILCLIPRTGIELNIKTLVMQMLPLLTNQYWFFTYYILLMVAIPFLNCFIQNVSKLVFEKTLVISLFTFSLIPTLNVFGDHFGTNKGFSLIWFCIVYLIAAYLRLYPLPKFKWGCIYLLLTVLLFATLTICQLLSRFVPQFIIIPNFVLAYNSIIVIAASVSIFLFVLQIKNIRSYRLSRLFARISILSFAVYLVHEHSQIRDILWDCWIDLSSYLDNPVMFMCRIVISIIAIFIIAIIVEFLRYSFIEKIIYVFNNHLKA